MRLTYKIRTPDRRAGQAMTELMIGMVAILAIISSLLHIAAMCAAHTDMMVEAREDAGNLAMTDLGPDMDILSDADYIRDWYEGADERRLSRDDENDRGDAASFQSAIVDTTVPDGTGWDIIDQVPNNRLSRLRSDPLVISSFGLVNGRATKSLDLDEQGDWRGRRAFQHLVYDSDKLDVEAEAWMTLCKGVY